MSKSKIKHKNNSPKRADYELFNSMKLQIAKIAKDSKDYERLAKIAADIAGV